ncbi:hypothetical protein [Streptomyces sp. CRN 30]|uniref:DUF7144 family membrane protein n=1 Tax=Streptomyces sp. CRN 30 TaxID=3075613 RepID=UPI002A80D1A1|nr:hypothetical protein [Streptomyces sp. CRN 30]
MAGQPAPDRTRPGEPAPEPHVSAVAVGGVVFAACVLGIIGTFHAIAGLTAILDENYYQQQNDYPFDFDPNVKGWVEMISGALVAAAAFTLFNGRSWSRAICMIAAGLSAVENFFFTPYHPVWSAIIIALDILVIWSLAMYGHREAHKVYGTPL